MYGEAEFRGSKSLKNVIVQKRDLKGVDAESDSEVEVGNDVGLIELRTIGLPML